MPCSTLSEYTTPLYTLRFKAAVASSFCAFIYSYMCTYLNWSQAPNYVGRHSVHAHTLLSCVSSCLPLMSRTWKNVLDSPPPYRGEPRNEAIGCYRIDPFTVSMMWSETSFSLHWDSLAISHVADFRCLNKWFSTRVTYFQYMQEFHFSLVVAINLVTCLPSLNIETECLGVH